MNTNQEYQGDSTKKEARELRRSEVQQGQVKAVRNRKAKWVMVWIVLLAVLGGIGWLVWTGAQNTSVEPNGNNTVTMSVNESDNIKGNDDAVVTLIEYGDYQCPACSAFYPVVEQLLESAGGRIRFVYRHFPLSSIHANARIAAQAVQAAGQQDAFWKMHAIVFERQTDWSAISTSSARDKMIEYAVELGLDGALFDNDIDSDAVKEKINSDIDSANAFGVNATPSFFVNGTYISNFKSFEDFQKKVLDVLESISVSRVDTSS